MRHLTLSAVLTASLFSGCIVYDNNCPDRGYDHDGEYGYDHDYDNEAPVAVYDLEPNTIYPGEAIISSLVSDMALNYETITEVSFNDDLIEVCTSTAREEELLLTVAASEFVLPGFVDMVITFETGEVVLVEGALEVLAPSGGNDGTPGGGNDGGTDGDGGGNDGGGTDGGTDGDNDASGDDGNDLSHLCG